MQCDSTISIEKEGRNSEKASVPSIDQISSTHFHSIFPFHFASSNPSFFIDPIASTISNKRFFFFIIHEFSHKHWNSIGSDGVVSISFELDHDTSFDLANDLHKLVTLPTITSEASARWTSARDSRLRQAANLRLRLSNSDPIRFGTLRIDLVDDIRTHSMV